MDEIRASRLLTEVQLDELREPEEFEPEFRLLEFGERRPVETASVAREGQGAFRARLLAVQLALCHHR